MDNFEITSPLDRESVTVNFAGTFAGKSVRWQAKIMTLQGFAQINCLTDPECLLRPFIEVGEVKPTGQKLEVVLNVPKIDKATVLKTMIMIRKYKRLHSGRHYFGEQVPLISILDKTG